MQVDLSTYKRQGRQTSRNQCMVGLHFQYCHERKQKLPQLSLRSVMNLEATFSENGFRGISLRTFFKQK